MKKKIREIIASYGITDRVFAAKCGLVYTTFNRQINSERGLSLEVVVAILRHCPEISADWLIRDKGDMLSTDMNNERIESLVDTIGHLNKVITSLEEENKLLKKGK